MDQLDQRPDHLSRRDAEKFVFLRRFAYDRRRKYRVAPPRNSTEMKYGKLRSLRIMSKVITEGPFEPALFGRYKTFEHDFRIGRDHDVDCLSADHRHTLPPQETG